MSQNVSHKHVSSIFVLIIILKIILKSLSFSPVLCMSFHSVIILYFTLNSHYIYTLYIFLFQCFPVASFGLNWFFVCFSRILRSYFVHFISAPFFRYYRMHTTSCPLRLSSRVPCFPWLYALHKALFALFQLMDKLLLSKFRF